MHLSQLKTSSGADVNLTNNYFLQNIINQELSMCKEKKKDLIADLENSSNQYALVESMLTRQDELLKRFSCLTFCRKLV